MAELSMGVLPRELQDATELTPQARRIYESNWPTPTRLGSTSTANRTAGRSDPNSKHHDGVTLTDAIRLWPAPNASVANDGEGVPLAIQAQESAALWSTPRASDGEKGGPHQQFGAGGTPLPAQAVSQWATPRAADFRSGEVSDRVFEKNARPLTEQVNRWTDGPASPPDPATATAGAPSSNGTPTSRLQLNAKFVAVLMGLAPEWISCEPSATPSCPSRQRPPSASSGTAPSASGREVVV
jgi:hypothetical protein